MKIRQLVDILEQLAPLSYQESYDNAGLITGNMQMEINSALVSLDITEEVIFEAIEKKANLIIAHHPIIFKPIKSLTGKNYVERSIILAIKNDIAIYAIHTNLDSVTNGVSAKMCEKLKLKNCKILSPRKGILQKLAFFVPKSHAEKVKTAIFSTGAGKLGNYDSCSFSSEGTGTFRGNENSNPYIGKSGKLSVEEEVKVELLFQKHLQWKVIQSLLAAHPYEEVAYDIYSLENTTDTVGHGMLGDLEKEMDAIDFLQNLKQIFRSKSIKYTKLVNKKIKKVALCGGSGSFLLPNAISAKADIFISGDFTYHQYFDAEDKIIIADIGHFESEQFTKDLLFDYLTKKIPTFAVQISKTNTNPINYI